MRVLVVDDEPIARRRLVRMLQRLPDVEVAGQASDGIEALERIKELRPDLVLLDIRMPGLDGISVAASSHALPPIVFTTAYSEYALDAFGVAAVDYLLKPIKRERLEAAIERIRSRAAAPDGAQLERLVEQLAQATPVEPAPVTARLGATVHVFDPREIDRFYASAKYTLFRRDGREYVLDETLASLERRLAQVGFLRVHRSELINLKRIKALRMEDGRTLIELADGQTAPVSRRLAGELRERLGIR